MARTKTYGVTLVGNGLSLVNNHPLLIMMCVSPIGKEFFRAIDPLRRMKHTVYITDVIKGYFN